MWLLLAIPGVLLLGALGFQHLGGYAPCEMCLWQRWPHLAAVAAAVIALGVPAARRLLLWLALAAVALSGAIGLFHAGVEQGWWRGPATCSSAAIAPGDFASAMIAAPVIRCDAIAWQLGGISMAGWNAIISVLAAISAAFLLLRRSRP